MGNKTDTWILDDGSVLRKDMVVTDFFFGGRGANLERRTRWNIVSVAQKRSLILLLEKLDMDSIVSKVSLGGGRKAIGSLGLSIVYLSKAARSLADLIGKRSNAAMEPWDSRQDERIKKKSTWSAG